MDSLALLCTLHADGPTTLARLRAAGIERIEDLAARDATDIEPLVSRGEASVGAARFLREAHLLAERMVTLEPEEARHEKNRPAQPVGPALLGSARTDPARRPQPPRKRRASGTAPGPVAVAAAEHREPASPPACSGASAGTPGTPGSDGSLPLVPGLLDDLDDDLLAALGRAGVRTLGELGAASGLALARRAGVAFTRILELQLAARHVHQVLPAPTPSETVLPSVELTPPSPALSDPPGRSDPASPAPRGSRGAGAAPRVTHWSSGDPEPGSSRDRRFTDRLDRRRAQDVLDTSGPFA